MNARQAVILPVYAKQLRANYVQHWGLAESDSQPCDEAARILLTRR
jgi:hypothetical protein